MQNNCFKSINVSTRILIVLLLGLSIFIANSIYLIIFLSILILISLILTNKNVKNYIYFIKKIKFLLLFILVAYIIIFRNIFGLLIFIYKLILIVLIIKQFTLNINFESLNNGIKTLLRPFHKTKKDLDNLSYNITLMIYFIKFYINTDDKITNMYKNKKGLNFKLSLKKYILPRVFMTVFEITKLENSMKLKYYKPKFESRNIKSFILLLMCIILFIVVIFKEVIL